MQKTLAFNQQEQIRVKGETISGFLLHINPLQADGATVCDIADLNKIGIDIVVKRSNGREIEIFRGYLDDLLIGMYAQNTRLDIAKKKRSNGYLMEISFLPHALKLSGKDEMIVDIKAQNTSFTSLHVGNSSISFYTTSAVKSGAWLPQIKAFAIGNGEINFEKDLGSGVNKVVIATDFTADYETSAKAKVVTGDLRALGNFEKDFTEAQLLCENANYLAFNPDTKIEDLVSFWGRNGETLNNAKLRFKLDQGADKDAKVLALRFVPAH